MLRLIIITAVLTRHVCVTAIMRLLRIVAVMAVVMIRHIGVHVGLIMTQVHRFGLRVIRGEIAVVVRRNPHLIRRTTVSVPHRRTFDKHRAHDIVISIQITVSYHLYIQGIGTTLCDQSSYILEDRRSQACLDQVSVVIALTGLNDTQIIDPRLELRICSNSRVLRDSAKAAATALRSR